MDNKKFTNRNVDKISLKKGKEYMWKYIQSKVADADQKADEKATFGDFFRSLFRMPERLVSTGVISTLVIVALVFGGIFGNWFGSIKIETVHAAFEMVANDEDGSGVATDSSFTLTSTANLDENLIEENLKVVPEVAIDVEKTGNGKYKVTPVDDLGSNKIYQFTIKSESGEYSWAYQVQDTFKITGSIPGDKASEVPLETGIELNFSHENYENNFADHFEISPVARGSFEKHRDIVAFIPKEPLKEATIYTVTFKKGFSLKDSDKKIEEDYVFQFETLDPKKVGQASNLISFSKSYNEVGTKGVVGLSVYSYKMEAGEKVKVNVYKYKDADHYLEELRVALKTPSWSKYQRGGKEYETEGLEFVGNFETILENDGYYSYYIYLPGKTFEAGQYVFEIDMEGSSAQTLVQVTDLANSVNVTLTDTLIWAIDLASGKPVKGAKVEIEGLDKTYTTGDDGVAKFKTPDEWRKDEYSEDIFVKITTQDGKVIFDHLSSIYNGYGEREYWQSFSTDRPTYKPTDEVQFFGFVKLREQSGDLGNLKLQMVKDWDTYVRDVPLRMADDGTFIGKTDIKSFMPGYYYLKLYDGKDVISQTMFEVADYVKPAFDLILDTDKKAVFAGEKMNFHVKTQFFDGTPAANLSVYDHGVKGTFQTNERGEADISVTAEKNNCDVSNYYCSDVHSYYYEVTSSFAEETNLYDSEDVRIFDSHLNIDSESKVVEEEGKIIGEVKVKANWVDLSGINSDEDADYYDYLGKAAKDRIIDSDITEISWNKVEEGQRYNFITKKVEKLYRYEREEKQLEGFRLQTDENGEFIYKFEIQPEKYYLIKLYGSDDQGNQAHGSASVYGNLSRSTEYDYFRVNILNGEVVENDDWWWGGNEHQFDVGDMVEAAISNNDVPLDKDTKGNFLFMQESNGLQEYEVTDSPYYSFKFSKDDIPSVYVDGIWFDGQEFVPIYGAASAKYDRDIQKLDIEVETDKAEYLPGEEVTLSVKVMDADGLPAKAKINLNLVDEAYYKVAYDNFIDPLTEIYQENSMGVLLSYSSHENPLGYRNNDGGKGGCFTGETQIAMADGTTKAIKDIRKGDEILTKANEYSSRLVPAEVTGKVSKFVSEYLIINDNLEVTEEHVVFANGAWTRVADLKVGDSLLSKDGDDVEIFSIRRVVEPVWVYNIEIKGAHTYLANGFYVHNDKGDDYVRQNFKDTAVFEVIETGANGRGEVTFKLPDNVTSWRVIAKAIDTKNLKAGSNISKLKVSMPFFIDLIMNSEYSLKDKPMIKFRSYGKALKTDNAVVFKPEFDGKADPNALVNGKAFEGSYYTLPKLELGNHDVTVRAESGKLTDNVKESFEVKGSRLKKDVLESQRNVNNQTVFKLGQDGPTEIKLVDGGAAYFYEELWSLYYGYGDRLDQKISQIASAEILQKAFKEKGLINSDEANAAILSSYQRSGGLSLLPYSTDDLRLSAMVVAMDSDPERYSAGALKGYFDAVYTNGRSNLDELVYSLVGLASLKEPVLLSLREIQHEPKLSLEQKLYIALAFENLGSNREALAIFSEVYDKLAKEDDYKGVHETALGAVVAAGLNLKPEAEKLWKFVEFYGFDGEDVKDLYKLGYLRNSLRHANFKPAEFKVKVNEHEETVKIESWESKEIMAFPGDIVAVNVNEGEVAAVIHYEEFIEPEEFKKDDRLSVSRKYFVNDKEVTEFKEGDLVKVMLTLDAKDSVAKNSFKVTDILPSGLYPVTSYFGINQYYDSSLRYPYGMNGQELDFCWYPYVVEAIAGVQNPVIYYYARVVGPGEFYAEPAKIESIYDKNVANISQPSVIKINPVN